MVAAFSESEARVYLKGFGCHLYETGKNEPAALGC
jgi:hypothetical protein